LDKNEILRVLAAYSPPLSPSQIDEIAEKLALSEIVAAKGPVREAKTTYNKRR
jgi:hypothetical protein